MEENKVIWGKLSRGEGFRTQASARNCGIVPDVRDGHEERLALWPWL